MNTDVTRTTHPLLAQLRESGLVSASENDLGLATSETFEVLDAHGVPVRGLYALGPLLRGRLWEITAVPELRVAAQQLATRLLNASTENQDERNATTSLLKKSRHH